ncbi:hypothetical protein OM428_13980 [Enterococcus gallinarum]|nr:hypothetical protein [Enterococcus gallinarum]
MSLWELWFVGKTFVTVLLVVFLLEWLYLLRKLSKKIAAVDLFTADFG